jgi:squalene monooxygenase
MAPKEQVKYDVLVVGAGVVGCAAAKAFADQGRQVLILERNPAQPDRIVGELLQPGGVAGLEQLGLGDCVRGIDAAPVLGYHMFWRVAWLVSAMSGWRGFAKVFVGASLITSASAEGDID